MAIPWEGSTDYTRAWPTRWTFYSQRVHVLEWIGSFIKRSLWLSLGVSLLPQLCSASQLTWKARGGTEGKRSPFSLNAIQ